MSLAPKKFQELMKDAVHNQSKAKGKIDEAKSIPILVPKATVKPVVKKAGSGPSQDAIQRLLQEKKQEELNKVKQQKRQREESLKNRIAAEGGRITKKIIDQFRLDIDDLVKDAKLANVSRTPTVQRIIEESSGKPPHEPLTRSMRPVSDPKQGSSVDPKRKHHQQLSSNDRQLKTAAPFTKQHQPTSKIVQQPRKVGGNNSRDSGIQNNKPRNAPSTSSCGKQPLDFNSLMKIAGTVKPPPVVDDEVPSKRMKNDRGEPSTKHLLSQEVQYKSSPQKKINHRPDVVGKTVTRKTEITPTTSYSNSNNKSNIIPKKTTTANNARTSTDVTNGIKQRIGESERNYKDKPRIAANQSSNSAKQHPVQSTSKSALHNNNLVKSSSSSTASVSVKNGQMGKSIQQLPKPKPLYTAVSKQPAKPVSNRLTPVVQKQHSTVTNGSSQRPFGSLNSANHGTAFDQRKLAKPQQHAVKRAAEPYYAGTAPKYSGLIKAAYGREQNDDDYEDEYDDEEEDDDMADFIDDTPIEAEAPVKSEFSNYSKHIREIFGYDRRKYANERTADDRAMEVRSYKDILKEEAYTLRAGLLEDLDEMKKGSTGV